jgi:hypothetical protein
MASMQIKTMDLDEFCNDAMNIAALQTDSAFSSMERHRSVVLNKQSGIKLPDFLTG